MRLSRNAARDVRRLVLDVVLLDGEQDAAPSLEDMARRAKALLDGPFKEDHRRASRRKDRTPRAPGESKAAKREERNARVGILRTRVFDRAAGSCECCRSRPPVEWHHLISGGARRTSEAYETTAAICTWCHADLHRNKWHALAVMRAWARDNGYLTALAAIERRLDKLSEATHPAPTQAGGTKP